MASGKSGKDCKVSMGATGKVELMGTWNMTGVSTELYEETEFGDEWKQYVVGLKDGGQITFNGLYDPTDTDGQNTLRSANEAGTLVTSLRLYVDDTSYWTPTTTNPVSGVYVTDWDVAADKNGLVTTSFTCKISGKMELI